MTAPRGAPLPGPEPKPAVAAALDQGDDWLSRQQAADGSFGGGTSQTPNTNSTGLAGWALGVSGARRRRAKAASGWVRGLPGRRPARPAPLSDESARSPTTRRPGKPASRRHHRRDQRPVAPGHRAGAARPALGARTASATGASITGPTGFVKGGTARPRSTVAGAAAGERVCFTDSDGGVGRSPAPAAPLTSDATAKRQPCRSPSRPPPAARLGDRRVQVLGRDRSRPRLPRPVHAGRRRSRSSSRARRRGEGQVTVDGKRSSPRARPTSKGAFAGRFRWPLLQGRQAQDQGRSGQFKNRKGATTFTGRAADRCAPRRPPRRRGPRDRGGRGWASSRRVRARPPRPPARERPGSPSWSTSAPSAAASSQVCDAGGGGKAASSLFTGAGFPLTYVQRQPGFVCRINQRPRPRPTLRQHAARQRLLGAVVVRREVRSLGLLHLRRRVASRSPTARYVGFAWQTGSQERARTSPRHHTPAPRRRPRRPPRRRRPVVAGAVVTGTAAATGGGHGSASRRSSRRPSRRPPRPRTATPTATPSGSLAPATAGPDETSDRPAPAPRRRRRRRPTAPCPRRPTRRVRRPHRPTLDHSGGHPGRGTDDTAGALPAWVVPLVLLVLAAGGGAAYVLRRRHRTSP